MAEIREQNWERILGSHFGSSICNLSLQLSSTPKVTPIFGKTSLKLYDIVAPLDTILFFILIIWGFPQ